MQMAVINRFNEGVELLQKFIKVADLIGEENELDNVGRDQFWSALCRFFNYLFVARKVRILKCEMFLTTAGNQKCLCFCLSCLPSVPKIRF